jgi:uncharacterized LabA/DUF88 family protein
VGIYLLIDYYNLPPRIRNGGVASAVMQIEAVAQSAVPGSDETHARLYGGWYDESGLSRDGTKLTQQIMLEFPRTYRGPRGALRRVTCEIASSLVQVPSNPFPATVRIHRGIERFLRLPAPPACADSAGCTVPSVLEWSRKGCPTPGCRVVGADAFAYKRQKLVDVLLCCDLLALATGQADNSVFLVSEDDDFIPALVQARLSGATVSHVRSKPKKVRVYDAMLYRSGIRVLHI